MSKAAAIHTAICLQLASQGKSVPGWNGHLGDAPPGAQAGAAGQYDAVTIRAFLANVASRLRADTPPLAFKWSALDTDRCVTDELHVLEMNIADATTAFPPPEPKESAK